MTRKVGRRGLAVAAVAAVVAVGGGVAYATGIVPPAATGSTVVACVQKENGSVRIVSSAALCHPVETAVTLATPPHPTVETVNCGTGQVLQQAINAADPTQPLTITILGTCAETVSISRDHVTLTSGSAGSGINGGLDVGGGRWVNLQGIKISGSGANGFAIFAVDGALVNGQNNQIDGNVYAEQDTDLGFGSLTMDGCSHGLNAQWGSVIEVSGGSISGCTEEAVHAGSDSGIWLDGVTVSGSANPGVAVDGGSTVTLSDDVLSNDAGDGGPAINDDDGSVSVSNTSVSGSDIGLQVNDGGHADVNGTSVISGNGIGIFVKGGSTVAVGGTVKNNSDDGISLSDTSVATLDDPTVTGNTGWGVHCDASPSVAVIRGDSSDVSGNTGGNVDCANAGSG